jgi:glyoxylate reductase
MPKVYITGEIENNGIELLKRHGFETEKRAENQNLSHAHLKEIFSRFEAVITLVSDKIDSEIIKASSEDFRVISNYAVGFDNIDVLTAKRRGIIVCNTQGIASDSVAEHTFMLILACAKRVIEADRYVRAGKYTRWDPKLFVSPALWGQTLGIIGLGKIGIYVGHIGYGGFKMRILYSDVEASEDFELLTEAQRVSLERLLKESDVISVHAPLNEKTKHLISTEEFKLMKATAIIVNTGRGPIIDQDALITALKEKEIRAAGLDVYEDEYHVPQELKTLGNVVLTPHMASATVETREAMSRIAAQNIIDVFAGKEPEGLVVVN